MAIAALREPRDADFTMSLTNVGCFRRASSRALDSNLVARNDNESLPRSSRPSATPKPLAIDDASASTSAATPVGGGDDCNFVTLDAPRGGFVPK